jgi:hypothetical protein
MTYGGRPELQLFWHTVCDTDLFKPKLHGGSGGVDSSSRRRTLVVLFAPLPHLSPDSGCILLPQKCPVLLLSSRSRYSVVKDRNKSIPNKDVKKVMFLGGINIYLTCEINRLSDLVPIDPDRRAFFGVSTVQHDALLLGVANRADHRTPLSFEDDALADVNDLETAATMFHHGRHNPFCLSFAARNVAYCSGSVKNGVVVSNAFLRYCRIHFCGPMRNIIEVASA